MNQPPTDFNVLAAKKGIPLKGILATLTIQEAQKIINGEIRKAGIGKSKVKIIRQVNDATSKETGKVLEYLDQFTERMCIDDSSDVATVIDGFVRGAIVDIPVDGPSESDKHIVEEYFVNKKTLEVIGRELGVTRERIRQIRDSVLEPIKVAQEQSDVMAEAFRTYIHRLILLGASEKELKYLRELFWRIIPDSAAKQWQAKKFTTHGLEQLVDKYLKFQRGSGAFPVTQEELLTYLGTELQVRIDGGYQLAMHLPKESFFFYELDGKVVVTGKRLIDRTQVVLMQHPDGLTAGEIAAELNTGIGVVSANLSSHPKLCGYHGEDRRYRLLSAPREDWMTAAFRATAELMDREEISEVNIDKFREWMLKANPQQEDKIKRINARDLAHHARWDSESGLITTGRHMIGRPGGVGLLETVKKAANELGCAFLMSEIREKMQGRVAQPNSINMVFVHHNGVHFQKCAYYGLGIEFIKNLAESSPEEPSQGVRTLIENCAKHPRLQTNHILCARLKNACEDAGVDLQPQNITHGYP